MVHDDPVTAWLTHRLQREPQSCFGELLWLLWIQTPCRFSSNWPRSHARTGHTSLEVAFERIGLKRRSNPLRTFNLLGGRVAS